MSIWAKWTATAPIGGKEIVEADKAYIGGKDEKGKDDKTVVLGMVERGGEVVTRIVPDRRETTVVPHILETVRPGTRIATDEGRAFLNLRKEGYRHGTVIHSKGEYVRGPVHTNTIEGFWNLFKGAYRGTYVHVSEKYLDLYLGEFEYRWNLRKQPHLMLPILLQAFSKPTRRAPSVAEGGQSVA